MIEFKEVSKSFGQTEVLRDQSFEIRDGEFLVLVGPSGSGKTSLLKMLNRLIQPSSGQILLDGQSISDINLRDLRLSIGYVLQEIALFPNLSVGENIEVIPKMKGWSKEKRQQAIASLLDRVGLPWQDYINRLPKDLSGGEQQRVGILRAILTQPKILLMDEPFSALDHISRQQLQGLIKALHQEFGMTIVFVTHDVEEAMVLADRIAVLYQGELVQLDKPEVLLNHPGHPIVSELFGGLKHDSTY